MRLEVELAELRQRLAVAADLERELEHYRCRGTPGPASSSRSIATVWVLWHSVNHMRRAHPSCCRVFRA